MAPTHTWGIYCFLLENKKASGYSPKACILSRQRPDYTMDVHGSHTRGADIISF